MLVNKLIIVGMFLIICVTPIAGEQIDYLTFNEYETKCHYGVYIEVFGINNTYCIISIYERTNNIDCSKYISRSFAFLNIAMEGDYLYINERDSMINPRFWYWFDYDMNISIFNILNNQVTLKIITGDTPVIPTPTPAPDPTPTPSPDPTPTPPPDPTPTPTHDGGGVPCDTPDGGNNTGTGGEGGKGELYDKVGDGLGDAGSGGKGAFNTLFYMLIPILFMLCVFKMISKVIKR